MKTVRPRLSAHDPARVRQAASIDPDSWRSGKTTSAQRGYGYKWQKARERFLKDHPLCVYCERVGKASAASVVDHMTPHRGDPTLFWNEANWQPLCASCHSSLKQAEERQSAW